MKFLAVVHCISSDSSLPMINVERAIRAGADGVFLINHGVGLPDLVDIANHVYASYPDLWIGMNFLGARPTEAFHLAPDFVKGIWTDNAGDAAAIQESRRRSEWKGEYFGGVAFKYQPQPSDLRAAVTAAADYMEVVTTSGPGTGKAPEVEKIRVMGETAKILGRGLAIASGVTPENVAQFKPHASHVLVATGVSKSFQELDLDRMKALVDAIRS